MTGLNRGQYDFLTRGIDGNRVQNLKGNSHLEAWDVRRHLIRVFGFDGFDIETKALDLVAQIEHVPGSIKRSNGGTNDRTAWTVVYRAEVRLSIKVNGKVIAVFEDGAAGDAANQPSLGDAHDMAAKTALSQGLKRCAVNLGDQFGLSLYNGGRQDPVVNRSLVVPEGGDASSAALPVDDAPVLPEPGPVVAEPEPTPATDPVAGEAQPVTARMVEPSQHRKMRALWRDLGYDGDTNRQARLDATTKILGFPVESSAALTFEQAEKVIAAQQAKKRMAARQTAGASA